MRVAVIGGGVVGVCTAYYLAEAGHEVAVIERYGNVAQEASFGNLDLMGPSGLRLWATPGALGRVAAEDPVVGSVRMPSGARFDFGPFPSSEAFRDLKSRGYTAVVSLLHPAVVPVEPPLMQREASDAARAGMRLIPAPMLPWLISNDEALRSVVALAHDSTERFFVHCYLGRDRVRMMQRFLLANGGTLISPESDSVGRTVRMERGSVVAFARDSVVVGPAPTDDELLSVILERRFATVVSLLYPSDTSEARVTAHEREALAKFGIPVCPHAGGVGLCEYVQHLALIDYIAIAGSLENRLTEYSDHLHEPFINPVNMQNGRYMPPTAPGYSITMKPEVLDQHDYPTGAVWKN